MNRHGTAYVLVGHKIPAKAYAVSDTRMFERTRRMEKPIMPKPRSIIAHVAGSGTAGAPLPSWANTLSECPSAVRFT